MSILRNAAFIFGMKKPAGMSARNALSAGGLTAVRPVLIA